MSDFLTLLSIMAGSFVTEDGALFATVAMVQAHKIPLWIGMLGNVCGQIGSDMTVYTLGYFAQRALRSLHQSARTSGLAPNHRLILLARMIPGTRLPVFGGSGFFRYPPKRFLALIAGSSILWVSFWFGVGQLFPDQLSAIRWYDVLFGIMFIFVGRNLIKFAIACWKEPWHFSLRMKQIARLRYFRYWPAWVFQFPVLVYYIYLAIRYRGFTTPYYVSAVSHNQVDFDSNWRLFHRLPKGHPGVVKSKVFGPGTTSASLHGWLRSQQVSFPLVAKTDLGTQSGNVQVFYDPSSAREFIRSVKDDFMLQEFSLYDKEAELFFYRHPGNKHIKIFSAAVKEFPFVIGDGKSSLRELILRDHDLLFHFDHYRRKWAAQFEEIIPAGQHLQLSEFGLAQEGAVYRDARGSITAELEHLVADLLQGFPDLYGGRVDLKFQSWENLIEQHQYKVFQLKGAGSQVSHIWDPDYRLFRAYGDLLHQWRVHFIIGHKVRGKTRFHFSVRELLRRWLKFFAQFPRKQFS